MPDYAALRAEAVATDVGAGGTAFAGQADDPFFLDLRVFDLLYGGDLSEVGLDTLDGYNVNSIALQVPEDALALNGDDASQPGDRRLVDDVAPRPRAPAGDGLAARPHVTSRAVTQVSRLGNPLVNEVVIPVEDKDRFNASRPSGDAAASSAYVQDRRGPAARSSRPSTASPVRTPTRTPRHPARGPRRGLPHRCLRVAPAARSVDALDADLNASCSTTTSTRPSSCRRSSCG